MVLEKKMERLRRIQFARREIIHTSYQEYQKMLMPYQWKYLPRTIDICAMHPFSAVVDAEANVVVTTADFEDAFCQLPELISAEFDARKLHARSLVKVPTSANQPASSIPELGPDVLDLAIAVFTCHEAPCYFNHRPYLFGWDDIAQHHCKLDLDSHSRDYWVQHHLEYEPGPPKIEFSALGSEIAAAVVRAVGLNDKIATISNMDEMAKDIRFGCSFCPPNYVLGSNCDSWMTVGYTWRELVCSYL
jgi:hypothetical protein